MSTTLTETSVFPATLDAPDNGESPQATSPGSPTSVVTVQEFLLALANRTRWLYNAVQGAVLGDLRVEILSNGTTSVVSGTVLLGDQKLDLTGTGQTFSPGSSARWLYLYVYRNAGVTTYEMVTTAPTADLLWRNDAVGTKRYLGAFRAEDPGSGYEFAPVRRLGGSTLYLTPRIITLARDNTAHLVDLSAWVPPTARRARVRLVAYVDTTATASLYLRAYHGGPVAWDPSTDPVALTVRQEWNGTAGTGSQIVSTSGLLFLDLSQHVWAQADQAGSSSNVAQLIVDGWEE